MGRLILWDDSIKNTISQLCRQKESIGFLLGQNTVQKDLVCHLAAIPKDGTDGTERVSKKNSRSKNMENSKHWDDVDEKWAVQQARQVVRMLPGGLTVLGLFAVCTSDALPNPSFTKIKQLLFAVFKCLNQHEFLISSDDVVDKVILHICSTTGKVVAKTVDISNPQNSAKPADFKYQQNLIIWHRFDCRVALDFSITFNADQSNLSLLKQIRETVLPFYTALKESVVLIDGKVRNSDELLDEHQQKRGKNKDVFNSTEKCHTAEVFLQQLSKINDGTGYVTEDCNLLMQLRGTLQSRAFINSKSTFEEAEHAIRQDIVRSLVSRCEIHCEDLLLIDEDQQDPNVVHEPPRRVFAHLPESDITVSDYLFPGENARDSLEAYQELLSLRLTEDEIEFECERLADSSDLEKVPNEKGFNVTSTSDLLSIPMASKSTCNTLVLLLSVAIATLAVSVAYLLFRSPDDDERS